MESINIPDNVNDDSENRLQSFTFDPSFSTDQLNDFDNGLIYDDGIINNKCTSKQKKKPIFKNHYKFSKEEDRRLIFLVSIFGEKDWRNLAKKMDGRNPRQCRERWQNYLNPNLNRQSWTKEEDEMLMKMKDEYGSKWKLISNYFQNRTDAMVKNRYNLLMRLNKKKNEEKELPSNLNDIQDIKPSSFDNNGNNIKQENTDNNYYLNIENVFDNKNENNFDSYFMNIDNSYEEEGDLFSEESIIFGNNNMDFTFA